MKLYAVGVHSWEPFLEVYDIHDTLEKALESIKQKKNRDAWGKQDAWRVIEFMLNETNDDSCDLRLYGDPSAKIQLKETNIIVDFYALEGIEK